MKLKLADRLNIVSILPDKGSFEKLIIREDIIKKTNITQEEITEFEIGTKVFDGKTMTTWNQKGVESEVEIEYTEAEKNHISTCLKELSDKNELTANVIGLYKLFLKND